MTSAEIIAFPLHRATRRMAPLENAVVPFARPPSRHPFENEATMFRVGLCMVALAVMAGIRIAWSPIDIAERIE